MSGTRAVPADDRPGEGERKTLLGGARVVSAGTLVSKLLGLLRDQALAGLFSAAVTDAFWVAFLLPNALRQLVAEGAMSNAVVPVLVEVEAREGEEAAREFFDKVRGLSLLTLTVITAFGVAAAPLLVDLFAHGQRARPEQFATTVLFSRWVFPYILFMGSAALGMAALNTHRRFVASSFAPGLLNVAFLTAMFALPGFFAARGYEPGLSLVVGALAGGLLQVVAQLPSLRAIGYLRRPRLDLGDPRVRRVLGRLAPMTLGLGIYYIDLVVCRRLLSEEGEGAQSWFSFAQRLCDFPQGVFAMALSAASLPSMASLAARGDRHELGRTFAYAMRLSLFVAIPISVLLVVLREPIVVTIFQRGHFDRASAHQTALALAAQGAGVWAFAATRQLVPVYYALGDTRTPVVVSAVDLLALIVFAAVCLPLFGHVGVSLAVTGSGLVQVAALFWRLDRALPSLFGAEIARSAAVTTASALLGAAGAWGMARVTGAVFGAGTVARTLPGLVGVTAFGGLFLTAAWALRSDELTVLGGDVARRVWQRLAR